MSDFVKENYEYMLRELGKTRYDFKKETGFSEKTEQRMMSGGNLRDKTLRKITEYYNAHGAELYPHHIDLDDFRHKDLSRSTQPRWENDQVTGEYIGLYLSRRGTGKPKAMVLTIVERQDHTLEARAIDTVQDPVKATDLIASILSVEDLDQARQVYKTAWDEKRSSLRGSRFLHGEVSGRGDLLLIYLKNDQGTCEVQIATSLKSYMSTYNKVSNKYNWRGGAVIASVYDFEAWPYSMIIGMMKREYWHPDLMSNADIISALQRMHSYQKKENMLCLQHDIDALWYESFVDIHRQGEG